MSISLLAPTPAPNGAGGTGLSTDAKVGLAVCSFLFVFIVVTFLYLSRRRQMCCFRSSDVEAQHRRDTVEQLMSRLSKANANRARSEELVGTGCGWREGARGIGVPRRPEVSHVPATTTVADLRNSVLQLPAHSASAGLSRPVYDQSPKTTD